jgi:hypothetical protein
MYILRNVRTFEILLLVEVLYEISAKVHLFSRKMGIICIYDKHLFFLCCFTGCSIVDGDISVKYEKKKITFAKHKK